MPLPQYRHRPRNIEKLSNGTKSRAASRCPHASHADRANATGRPAGKRRTRTPNVLPAKGAATSTSQSIRPTTPCRTGKLV